MKLSTKGRYAMVALADLAQAPEGVLVSLGELSKRQDISLPYLEQLFVKLRRAGLVESVRGPGGGYSLAKPASEIRVAEILGAVDETVSAMEHGAGASGAMSGTRAQSMTNRLWEGNSAWGLANRNWQLENASVRHSRPGSTTCGGLRFS